MSKTTLSPTAIATVLATLTWTTRPGSRVEHAEAFGLRIERESDGNVRMWHDASGVFVGFRPGARGAWRVRTVKLGPKRGFAAVWPSCDYMRESYAADGITYGPEEARAYADRFLARLALRLTESVAA